MSTRHSFLSTTGLIRPPSVASVAESTIPSRHAHSGGTKPGRRTPKAATKPAKQPPVLRAKAGVIPLGPAFVVGIAVFLSLLFIAAISCAFISDEDERSPFADLLDDTAANTPGIVLIGDDVDVDIDEPAVTIRWSIIACGQAFVLPGSGGTHGSAGCGLPNIPLNIFVDGTPEQVGCIPVIPLQSTDDPMRSIQNLFQFDDDHVLDVHRARFYPFDTYILTTSVRVEDRSANDQSLPIQHLSTISLTSSFVISSTEMATYTQDANGVQQLSGDLTLRISRPAEARMYALLLFGASWMLAHATVGLVAYSWRSEGSDKIRKQLVFILAVILVIPQLRSAMPDAPGFDDAIGFFPQMLVASAATIMLIAMMVKREIQAIEEITPPDEERKEAPAPLSTGLLKMRRGGASVDISHVRNLSRSFTAFGRPTGCPQ
ncbi:hypothetical protein BV20DRAFT_1038783 [Pilatotrama ljubarskyi]|nr:hypothetical protein BV20DRAFT_1038783 [Pilatotrama ljubarskyi]